jgi:hypothetical protein
MGLLEQSIKYLGHPAILLGNGINQCANIYPTWRDLLNEIGGGDINSEGLTNTEIYDFIELRTYNADKLKSIVANKFEDVKDIYSTVYLNFLELVRRKNCPILTTNFDFALEKVGQLDSFRTSKHGFTRFYPWDTYYGDTQHNLPTDGFGVWHIHGMLNYHDSIRMGLTDYMGSVERARKLIHAGDGRLFEGKDQNNWKGRASWLHIWFNMPLIIVGFGLSSDEVFIRWLLIERKKYFQRFPERRKDTMFLSTGRNERVQNFLYNLNIENRVVKDYHLLYC